jgi:hypothetical protein
MTTVAAFVPVCASLVLPDSVAQFINGATLLALGVSIALGDRYPNGLALWVRRRSGFVAGGTVTAHTGFSATAGWS